jgi:chromosome segregation ATPase
MSEELTQEEREAYRRITEKLFRADDARSTAYREGYEAGRAMAEADARAKWAPAGADILRANAQWMDKCGALEDALKVADKERHEASKERDQARQFAREADAERDQAEQNALRVAAQLRAMSELHRLAVEDMAELSKELDRARDMARTLSERLVRA